MSRLNRRSAALIIGALLLLMLAGLWVSLCVGAEWTAPRDVLRAVVRGFSRPSTPAETTILDQIVWDIRAPRALLAVLVGGGLAVAGVVIQTAVRNALADPYILGVSSGSSFGAVLLLFLAPGAFGGGGLFTAAFAGGAAASLLVYLIARQQTMVSPQRLILSGVATSYLLTALTSFVLVQVERQGIGGSNNFLYWTLGSLARANWSSLAIPAAAIGVSQLWLLLQGNNLDCLIASDESATALGAQPQRMRCWLFAISILLVGACVSASGPIGFVGLMIPHAARMLVGPRHRLLLIVGSLLGAIFLLAADTIGRIIGHPNEVAVGIIAAMCGAPCFLIILRRTRGGEGA